MKILQLTDYYDPKTGHITSNVSERLKKRGHGIIVYTSTLSVGSTKYDDSNSPVKIKRFTGFEFAGKAIYPGIIPKLIFQENPDVVHSYVAGFFSTFIAGYLKKIKGYPLVVLADFDIAEPEPSILKKPYIWLYRKIPLQFADLITTFTEQEKEEVSRRFDINKDKIMVLPTGIDFNKFSSPPSKDLRKRLNFENKFVILNVSFVVPKKNIEGILRAMRSIDNNVIFLHVGNVIDPEYQKYLDKLVEDLKIGDKVRFIRNVQREEIYDYYKVADVFVQCGYRESFVIAILEAMASGVPVITTQVGIANEVIKDGKTGFIIKDERDIANKIELLINNRKLRERMGVNCKKVAKNYDWEIIVDRLEEIYETLV